MTVSVCSLPVKLRGTLTPDTYKPVLSVVALPLNKEDQFVPGEYYSPRIKAGASSATAAARHLLAAALAISTRF